MPELRLYAIVRGDLENVPTGKWMVQAGHLFVGTLLSSSVELIMEYQKNARTPKIVLMAKNEEQIRVLEKLCIENKIPHHLVTDLGLTVFNHVPTLTSMGIGPITQRDADKILNLRSLPKF